MHCRTAVFPSFSPLAWCIFLLRVVFLLILSGTAAHAAEVLLTWQENTENDLAGYKLYYGLTSRSYGASVDVGAQPLYLLTGLEDGRTYYIAVTAYDTSGNESAYSSELIWSTPAVSANEPPSALITATSQTGEAPFFVSFDGSAASDPDGSIIGFSWDFADGEVGTGVTVDHTFWTEGVYDVVLRVTDDQGATGQAVLTVTVVGPVDVVPNQDPVAVIAADTLQGEAPLPVRFDGGNSSDPDGSLIDYAWDFGDGDTGSGIVISHSYSFPGTYTVTLTVTDSDGATASIDQQVVVTEAVVAVSNEPPVAMITVNQTSGLVPLVIYFDGSDSTDLEGAIVSYAWDFGDGETGSGLNVEHTYWVSGKYTAVLTVTDDQGATGQIVKQITAKVERTKNNPPKANINSKVLDRKASVAAAALVPEAELLQVSFDGSESSDSDGSIESYFWNFGDGETASGVSATHGFVRPGTYSVTLTVQDDAGAVAEAVTKVVALPQGAPIAEDSQFETQEGVPVGGFLRAADPDGDELIYIIVANGDKGKVVLEDNTSGGFYYTPDSGVSGSDTFTFKVFDGSMESAEATVTVNIDATPAKSMPDASEPATAPGGGGGGGCSIRTALTNPGDGGDWLLLACFMLWLGLARRAMQPDTA